MAVVQISRIQHRRGKRDDLPRPNLNEGEFGFATDSGELFIGAPNFPFPTDRATNAFPYKNIEVLTEFSNLNLATSSEYSFTLPGGSDPTSTQDWIVERTLQSKLDDFVSVKDYGAVGDGIRDDSQEIIRAILDVLRESLGAGDAPGRYRVLYFPAGQYRITVPLPIPPRAIWVGEGVADPATGDEIAASGIIADYDAGGFDVPYMFTTLDSSITELTGGIVNLNPDFTTRDGMQIGTNGTLPNDIYISHMAFYATNYTAKTEPGIQMFRLHRGQRIGFSHCDFRAEYSCASNTDPLNRNFDLTEHSLAFDIDGLGDVVVPNDIYFEHCRFRNFHRIFVPVNAAQFVTVRNSTFEDIFKPISLGEDEWSGGTGSQEFFYDPTIDPAQPTAWRVLNCRFNKINSNAIAVYTQYTSGSMQGTGHTFMNNRYEQVGNNCVDFTPLTTPQVPAIYLADGTGYNQSIGDVFHYDGPDDQSRIRFNPVDDNLIVDPQLTFFPDASTIMATDSTILMDSATASTNTGILFDPAVGNQIIIHYSISRGTSDRKGTIHITAAEDGSDFDWTETYTENTNPPGSDLGFDLTVETDGSNNIILTYEDTNPTGSNGTLYYNTNKWLSL